MGGLERALRLRDQGTRPVSRPLHHPLCCSPLQPHRHALPPSRSPRSRAGCKKASSPLYQSFNVFLRHQWVDARGLDAVAAPDRDRVHIVVGARAVESNKNKESTARFVKNMDALVAALGQIRGVRVTVQDFAKIDFAAQVGLCVCACGGYVVGSSYSFATLSFSVR